MSKLCKMCLSDKQQSEFSKRSNNRDRLSNVCRPCDAANQREYRRKNRERIYIRDKAYREANAEKLTAYFREYKAVNRARILEESRQYYAKDPDGQRRRSLAWRHANPEKARALVARRRHMRRANGTAEDAREADSLMACLPKRCIYCADTESKLTIEHVIPLSRGGKHHVTNVAWACQPCNSRKNAKTWSEYVTCERGADG